MHKRIDACVVGCGGKNQFAVAESIGESQGHIVSCQIVYDNLWTAFASQFVSQQIHCFFCMSVDRSVGDHDTFFFRCVGRPGVVQTDVMSEIF